MVSGSYIDRKEALRFMLQNNSIGIGVFLATYNSEAFLLEQLESILSSVPAPAAIVVSDDNSTDSTRSILYALEPQCASRDIELHVYKNSTANGGLHGNFQNLLRLAAESDFDVFFLCDHDDIWDGSKASKSLSALDEMMRASGSKSDKPALVFSDLEVIDEEGKMMSPSFAKFQGLPYPKNHSLERLFHQNVVTGCTTCFNRALLEAATPVPDAVVMHDHWLALCARVFGDWHYIDEPLVRYRQHGSNAVGAKRHHRSGIGVWFDPVFLKALSIFPWHFAQSIEQAKALLDRIELSNVTVAEADVKTIKAFVLLKEAGFGERVRQGLKWVSMGNGVLERIYLIAVFVVLPYLRVRKAENAI